MLNSFLKRTHGPCQCKHQQSWEAFTGSLELLKDGVNVIASNPKSPGNALLVQNVLGCQSTGCVPWCSALLPPWPQILQLLQVSKGSTPDMSVQTTTREQQTNSTCEQTPSQCDQEHWTRLQSTVNLLWECEQSW